MTIAYIRILNEDGRRCFVRADEIGTFYESAVIPRRNPGRPRNGMPVGPPKPVLVISLLLRNGNRLNAKGETLESIGNMMQNALGGPGALRIIEGPNYEPGTIAPKLNGSLDGAEVEPEAEDEGAKNDG